MQPPLIFGSVDYALDWPRPLVRSELLALYEHPFRGWVPSEVERLLEEAFHTEIPVRDFRETFEIERHQGELWAGRSWVDELLAHLDEVREHAEPAPYWPVRQLGVSAQASGTPQEAPFRFAFLIWQLRADGYLARDFAAPCVNDDPLGRSDHNRRLNEELQARLNGVGRELWPLRPETLDPDTFYGLVEALHDLVARPRRRWLHEPEVCGPHFADFDIDAGRRVYRALVNRVLAENGVDLRLAADGEDEGRLVRVVDEARTNLVEQALHTSAPDVQERIRHAIAQFRRRDAAEHDKRSAVLTLAGILEERRELIKERLVRKDEGALFQIANEFAIRHQRPGQQGDYDPAFLDWIFWWYLGTIELTDRLLARQAVDEASA